MLPNLPDLPLNQKSHFKRSAIKASSNSMPCARRHAEETEGRVGCLDATGWKACTSMQSSLAGCVVGFYRELRMNSTGIFSRNRANLWEKQRGLN